MYLYLEPHCLYINISQIVYKYIYICRNVGVTGICIYICMVVVRTHKVYVCVYICIVVLRPITCVCVDRAVGINCMRGVCICVHMCVYIDSRICIYIYIHKYKLMCMYIYVCTWTHTCKHANELREFVCVRSRIYFRYVIIRPM